MDPFLAAHRNWRTTGDLNPQAAERVRQQKSDSTGTFDKALRYYMQQKVEHESTRAEAQKLDEQYKNLERQHQRLREQYSVLHGKFSALRPTS